MTDTDGEISRRGLLRAAAGGATATAATGTAAAQKTTTGGGGGTATGTATGGGGGGGGGSSAPPDLGGYLDGVTNFDGVVDKRGQDEVTVEVGVQANGGPYGFGPAAVHVDNGATVKWKWTGKGGRHNVVNEGGAFESDLYSSSGVHFEHTFNKDGVYNYYCQPHKPLGMKGSVVVGSDYPTKDTGGGGGQPRVLPGSAKTLGIATSFVMLATLGLAYFFIRYGGDYGDFEE